MEDYAIEMLRSQANTKEENEHKNLYAHLKNKRRFGGNKASLGVKLIASVL